MKNNDKFLLLYGGQNTMNPPFKEGDLLQQKYYLNSDNELVYGGKSNYEFMGMKGDMMLLKSLNDDALYGTETVNPRVINMAKRAGYKPDINSISKLHYMYADRFKIVDYNE